jgi:hypothetical protein
MKLPICFFLFFFQILFSLEAQREIKIEVVDCSGNSPLENCVVYTKDDIVLGMTNKKGIFTSQEVKLQDSIFVFRVGAVPTWVKVNKPKMKVCLPLQQKNDGIANVKSLQNQLKEELIKKLSDLVPFYFQNNKKNKYRFELDYSFQGKKVKYKGKYQRDKTRRNTFECELCEGKIAKGKIMKLDKISPFFGLCDSTSFFTGIEDLVTFNKIIRSKRTKIIKEKLKNERVVYELNNGYIADKTVKFYFDKNQKLDSVYMMAFGDGLLILKPFFVKTFMFDSRIGFNDLMQPKNMELRQYLARGQVRTARSLQTLVSDQISCKGREWVGEEEVEKMCNGK